MKKLILKVNTGNRIWKFYLVDAKSPYLDHVEIEKGRNYVIDRDADTDEYSALGATNYDNYEIFISKAVSLSNAKMVIYHELRHAFLDSYGLTFDNFNSEAEAAANFAALGKLLYSEGKKVIKEHRKIMLELNKKGSRGKKQ